MTRRLCGRSCVDTAAITEEHYKRAVTNLLEFDLVMTTDGMSRNEMHVWCVEDTRWCNTTTRMRNRRRKPKLSGFHGWYRDNATEDMKQLIGQLTKYDLKLYAVAQQRHARFLQTHSPAANVAIGAAAS